MAVSCDFNSNIDSALSWMRTNGAINKDLSIKDMTKFNTLNDRLFEKHLKPIGETQRFFEGIDGFRRAQVNTWVFEKHAQFVNENAALDLFMSDEALNKFRTDTTMSVLLEKFHKSFNIPYKIVSEQEAIETLKNTKTPYDGSPGFYFGNTVYLLADKISESSILHEYAHPFIQALKVDFPDTYKKLTAQLESTTTGQEIINTIYNTYPELEGDMEKVMEEALVTALEVDATNMLEEIKADDAGFKNFVEQLLFYLRKILRKMKLNTPEKLKSVTTVKDLADIFLKDEIKLQVPKNFNEDVAQFKRNAETLSENLADKMNIEDITKIINNVYSEMSYELNELKKAPYKLTKELVKANAKYYLKNIKDYLENYQTVINDPNKVNMESVINSMEEHALEMNKRSQALMNSISNIETFTQKINDVLQELQDSGANKNNYGIHQIMYFEKYLSRQKDFIRDIKKAVKLPNDNKFIQKLNNITNNIDYAQDKSKELKHDFVLQFFEGETDIMKENVFLTLKEKLSPVLKEAGFSVENIDEILEKIGNHENDKVFSLKDVGIDKLSAKRSKLALDYIKRYFAKRLGRQQIEDFVTGKRGDVGFFSAWITPYTNIDDPLIGSFARYMRSVLSDAEQESLKKVTRIGDRLGPLLKAVNWNKNNTTQLADLLLTKDKVGTIVDGEFKTKEILSFIDTHINWRADRGQLKFNLEKAREEGDKEEIKKAYIALTEFDEKYMYRKFKPEYYDVQKIWKTSNTLINPFTKKEIAISADTAMNSYIERQKVLEQLALYSHSSYDELEDILDYTSLDSINEDYSNLFNIYNPDGTEKTGEELEKVLVRRYYRSQSSKFYESITNDEKVQDDFNRFIKMLDAEGITEKDTPDKYKEAMDKFTKRNFRIAYEDSYYEKRNEILDEIKAITSEFQEQVPELKLKAELLEKRGALITRDSFGTPDGIKLSKEVTNLIKDIEVQIESLNQEYNLKTGLSSEENDEYYNLRSKLTKDKVLSPADKARYDELSAKESTQGMDPIAYARLMSLFGEYSDLVVKEPTDYYIEAFNYALGDIEIDAITKETADEFIENGELLLEAFSKNNDFQTWFKRNHHLKNVWRNNKKTQVYVRNHQWNISKPTDDKYIKKTILTNPITNESVTILGKASGKYSYRKVKSEYLTLPKGEDRSKYVGKYIDNKGNFLPRPYEPGNAESAVDNKYINPEYQSIKNTEKARFALLETMKEEYIKAQEGIGNSEKLYLDFARFRQSGTFESLQSGKFQRDMKDKFEGVKKSLSIKRGEAPADATNYGFNYELERKLVTTDMDGQPIDRIPIRGLADIDIVETSQDVLSSFFDYMHSIDLHKELRENEPIAKAIQDILSDKENGIKNMERASKQVYSSTKLYQYLNKTDNRRLQALDTFIDRAFYGKKQSSFEGENPLTTRLANMMMGAASRSFIALDVPSAMKNRWGMIFQSHIEAAGGKYVNFKTLTQGRIRSTKNIWELSTKDIYTLGSKSLDVQVMEIFDPITGKTGKEMGKSSSRSFIKDMFDMTWLYDFRRLAEVEAGLQVFWGMMYKKDVEQRMPDGTIKKIKYADAWEKGSDGIVKLKDGINPEYSNTNINYTALPGETIEDIAKKFNVPVENLIKKNKLSKNQKIEGVELVIAKQELFKDFKFKVQGVGKKLNGLMSELDAPQADKFLGYRLFTFYKKFATGMALNRYQADMDPNNKWGEVYDFEMNELGRGYWVTGLAGMIKFVKQGGSYYNLMTEEEKIAFKKILAEVIQLALITLTITFIFGYDMGDEDRFKKIRKREDEYGVGGWLANHLLYQLMMVHTENEAFTFMGGKQWLQYTDSTTIATGPTIELYLKILTDIYNTATGSDKAIYKQDAGPYPWQEEGRYKLWNHLFSIFGIKGKTYSPERAIKTSEIFENLR